MLSAGVEVDVLPRSSVLGLHSPRRDVSPSRDPLAKETGYNDLPRAASYTTLPGLTDLPFSQSIKRTFSEDGLTLKSPHLPNADRPTRAPSEESPKIRPQSYHQDLTVTQSTAASQDRGSTTSPPAQNPAPSSPVERPRPSSSRSVSSTFRNLARRSWRVSNSRSPSPSPSGSSHDRQSQAKSRNASPFRRSSKFPTSAHTDKTTDAPTPQATAPVPEPDPNRSPPKLRFRNRFPVHESHTMDPLAATMSANQSETDLPLARKPSLLSLRSKRSTDRLSKLPNINIPPVQSSLSSERSSAPSVDMAKKKDPLWNAFRLLEADYQKFQSKSSTLKANVIRSSLLPFLAKYADHPSNALLRSEDLDRRIIILNRWWTGQLEMLKGKNNQSITGTDRPTFLQGVTGIMMRPEWRLPSYANPKPLGTPPTPRPGMATSVSTTSLDSGTSDFLTESIHHNVRTIFTQNLLSQMAFVVEKMSMRSAPASLVAFCGKACAYAFFFCPDVAAILVRLWRPSVETLRRVLAELGYPRGSRLGADAIDMATHFPPAVRALVAGSHTALVRYLRQRVPLPLGGGLVRWYGPWVGRWNGRDSDLFFAFTKHYHLLAADMIPHPIERKARAGVPGLVLVHAQMLSCLESTLYRQGSEQQYDVAMAHALDDMDSPDAAMAVPLTAANAARSMTENRLVMLLRDLLADTNPAHRYVRLLFAESCGDIFKAAARTISIYNHDACFILCDFVEELLPIMCRYEQAEPTHVGLDWSFWLEVFRRMMENENTLVQVRLLAFLYRTWNTLIADEDRRGAICLGWLLERSFFDKFFNHWCPMVRAYYLRLLCWRLARCDGEATGRDVAVYQSLMGRLETSWTTYSTLRDHAAALDQSPPSSTPCSPAPGRRLVIIRDDATDFPVSMFTSFDTVLSQLSSTAARRAPPDGRVDSGVKEPADRPAPKKRWSFIKNIIPFGAPGNSRPGEVTPPGSAGSTSSTDGETAGEVDGASSSAHPSVTLDTPPTGPRSSPPHQAFCFKFSLERLDGAHWPSKNRTLHPPRLPPAAQAAVEADRERRRSGEALEDVPGDPRIESRPDLSDKGSRQATPARPADGTSLAKRYGGRALAEWAQIVAEHDCFFERRKNEGVPSDRLVETPVLGVESFRMSG